LVINKNYNKIDGQRNIKLRRFILWPGSARCRSAPEDDNGLIIEQIVLKSEK